MLVITSSIWLRWQVNRSSLRPRRHWPIRNTTVPWRSFEAGPSAKAPAIAPSWRLAFYGANLKTLQTHWEVWVFKFDIVWLQFMYIYFTTILQHFAARFPKFSSVRCMLFHRVSFSPWAATSHVEVCGSVRWRSSGTWGSWVSSSASIRSPGKERRKLCQQKIPYKWRFIAGNIIYRWSIARFARFPIHNTHRGTLWWCQNRSK